MTILEFASRSIAFLFVTPVRRFSSFLATVPSRCDFIACDNERKARGIQGGVNDVSRFRKQYRLIQMDLIVDSRRACVTGLSAG